MLLRRPDSTIRGANNGDIAALVELATTTYRDAFGHSFTPDDLAAHLARSLAPENVARFITEDTVLVAEAGQQLIGYVQFGPASTGYAPAGACEQELRRLYVLREFQNQGVGTLLMQAALVQPQMRSAPVIYLDVWEHNPGAQRFYQRHGFAVTGARSFAVASGAATTRDLIMARRA